MRSRIICREKALAVLLAAAVFFSGADLTTLATEEDTQRVSQETTIEDEAPDGEDASEDDLSGGGQTGWYNR